MCHLLANILHGCHVLNYVLDDRFGHKQVQRARLILHQLQCNCSVLLQKHAYLRRQRAFDQSAAQQSQKLVRPYQVTDRDAAQPIIQGVDFTTDCRRQGSGRELGQFILNVGRQYGIVFDGALDGALGHGATFLL